MRKAAQELAEEQKKAIRQIVEEEKKAVWAKAEALRQPILNTGV